MVSGALTCIVREVVGSLGPTGGASASEGRNLAQDSANVAGKLVAAAQPVAPAVRTPAMCPSRAQFSSAQPQMPSSTAPLSLSKVTGDRPSWPPRGGAGEGRATLGAAIEDDDAVGLDCRAFEHGQPRASEGWAAIVGAIGSAFLLAKKLLGPKPAHRPELVTRAGFCAEMLAARERINASHLAILDKLDANHRELLAALGRQAGRINALETGLARVDERARK